MTHGYDDVITLLLLVGTMDEIIGAPLLKALIWVIPVVFGAGGVYASFTRASTDVARVEASLAKSQQLVSDHVGAAFGHVAARDRIIKIERNQEQIIERQQRAGESIAAICQATGANCR